jgi:hypothetical protein
MFVSIEMTAVEQPWLGGNILSCGVVHDSLYCTVAVKIGFDNLKVRIYHIICCAASSKA